MYAEIAQLVEHFTRNEGVVGSSPIFSSAKSDRSCVNDPLKRLCITRFLLMMQSLFLFFPKNEI